MPNQVFLGQDGLIHQVYEDNQTYDTIKRDERRIAELVSYLKQQNQPAWILVDSTRLKKQDAGARRAAYEALNAVQYDKIALFGANRFLKHVANLIIKAAGKADRVRYFDTRQEAEQWLRSG